MKNKWKMFIPIIGIVYVMLNIFKGYIDMLDKWWISTCVCHIAYMIIFIKLVKFVIGLNI